MFKKMVTPGKFEQNISNKHIKANFCLIVLSMRYIIINCFTEKMAEFTPSPNSPRLTVLCFFICGFLGMLTSTTFSMSPNRCTAAHVGRLTEDQIWPADWSKEWCWGGSLYRQGEVDTGHVQLLRLSHCSQQNPLQPEREFKIHIFIIVSPMFPISTLSTMSHYSNGASKSLENGDIQHKIYVYKLFFIDFCLKLYLYWFHIYIFIYYM